MQLVFDFDGTITQQDTIGILAESAIALQKERRNIDLSTQWEQVVKAFDTEMEKVTKTGADPAAALKTVQQQAESIGTGQ